MDYLVTNTPEDFNHPNLRSVQECIEDLDNYNIIGYDTETTGLSFANSKITALAFSTPENLYVVDTESGISPLEFKKILETKELIVQDGQFDLCFLYDLKIIPTKIFDTKLAEHSLSLGINSWRRDLGALIKSYLDIDIDKSLQKEIMDLPLTDTRVLPYVFNDVRYLFDLRKVLIKNMVKWDTVRAFDLHNRFARVAAYIEYCGIKFDDNRLEKFYRRLEAEEWLAEDKLNVWLEKTTDIDPLDFNWASSAQVGDLLIDLGYDIWDKVEKRNTVEYSFLKKRYKDDDFIKMYTDYKKKNKLVTTYGRNWLENKMPDGLVHTKLKSLGAATGRTSCGDKRNGKFPNLQNIPRESAFRRIFIPRSKRAVFINLDYSQQEAVIMADKCKDHSMLNFFKSGGNDFHSFIAKKVWHEELGELDLQEINTNHKEQRRKAKELGFTLNYGGGATTFADTAEIPKAEAVEILRGYFEAFPALAKYFGVVTKEALKKGYVLINNITGAKRFVEYFKFYKLGKYNNKDVKAFEEKVRKMALNTPIQGTAADISKTAGILIFDWILANKRFGTTRIPLFVHDEYVIEETREKAEAHAIVFKELMEKAGTYFLEDLELKVTPKISNYWEH